MFLKKLKENNENTKFLMPKSKKTYEKTSFHIKKQRKQWKYKLFDAKIKENLQKNKFFYRSQKPRNKKNNIFWRNNCFFAFKTKKQKPIISVENIVFFVSLFFGFVKNLFFWRCSVIFA